MLEAWLPVAGFEDYLVSSKGRVKSRARRIRFLSKKGREFFRLTLDKIISQQKQNCGYLIVHLYKNNTRTAKTVHTLVARAFLGVRPRNYDVCHNDGNRLNNSVGNLRYATRSENLRDMRAHGTFSTPAAKLSLKDVRAIRLDRGLSTSELAKKFGVQSEAIRCVKLRKTWRYAP